MLTDKNKYKPGETVRFKAYAIGENNHPLTDSVEVWLKHYSKPAVKIKKIHSYNPGGYAGEFVLHDSLGLRLDSRFYIDLKTPDGKIIGSTNFSYEEYELAKTELKVTQKKSYHTSADENNITIHLTDANGLTIPDSKAIITVYPQDIRHSYVPLLIIPDTLLHTEIRLESKEATTFTIPNSLFKESIIRYTTEVTVESLEGFMEKRSFQSTFSYDSVFIANKQTDLKQEITYNCRNGNLEIIYTENNVPLICRATIHCDGENEKTVFLPYKEPLKQYVSHYTIYIPEKDMQEKFVVGNLKPHFDIQSRYSGKTVELELENPQGIDVNWYVYNGEKLLGRGFGKELKQTFPVLNPEATHTVELFYRLGTTEKQFRRDIQPPVKHFNIEHNLPERVYPGQQVETTISVTNPNGKPVAGVDLTTFAYNSTLNYKVPDLDLEKHSFQYRPYDGGFKEEQLFHIYNILDYNFWKTVAGLDTLLFYQFTHPVHELSTYTIETPDSTTQFAPFIVWKGSFYLPQVIECDGIPVWFSWTDYPDSYSFYISPDIPHVIDLYVGKEKITLTDISFPSGKKRFSP
ncbi:MAG: hypothetical protein LIP01_00635 [Tannerellaceae bacterium]|nr:hypothetical protein [Tannerellaceae bacterium]